MNSVKLRNLNKLLGLGAWDLKTTLGHLHPKDVSSHNFGTLAPFFTNRTSFSPETLEKFDIIMTFENIS